MRAHRQSWGQWRADASRVVGADANAWSPRRACRTMQFPNGFYAPAGVQAMAGGQNQYVQRPMQMMSPGYPQQVLTHARASRAATARAIAFSDPPC